MSEGLRKQVEGLRDKWREAAQLLKSTPIASEMDPACREAIRQLDGRADDLDALLAEPVEAGAGQGTPIMALRQRLDVACDSEGYLHRTEMNKVINEWIENSAWHWGMDVRTQPRNLAERFQLIAKALNAKDYKTAYEHAHSGYYDAVTGPEEPPAGESRLFEQWWMDWRYKNPKEEAAWAAKAAWNAALATREEGKG